MQNIPLEFRRAVRKAAGASVSCPVVIVDGDGQPEVKGRSYYWTTIGGKPIYYPNAYNWPKVYHRSSLRVEVGKEYLT